MHSIREGHHRDGVQQRPTFTPVRERNEAMRALGSVVYAAACEGGVIKIGVTANLADRIRRLQGELLAFAPGDFDDEQALHERLAAHRHHGREWYYPTPGVMAVINEMREQLGLPAVA